MPFVSGETIGPYVLLEQLGQGGMAAVFKAYHPALDRHVALKVLHPAFSHEPDFLARFRREAQVVARLEHSNIVPVYDFAEYEGRPYLGMKFIDGETLRARLGRGPLTGAELRRRPKTCTSRYTWRQPIRKRRICSAGCRKLAWTPA
jgi:serine/threonine protein kinase